MKIKGTEVTIIHGILKDTRTDAVVEETTGKNSDVGNVSVIPVDNGMQRYRIQVVTAGDGREPDEWSIRVSCKNALEKAEQLGLESITLPALGFGISGFSSKASAKIISQEILHQIWDNETKLKEIVVCLAEDEVFGIFQKNALGYLDYIVNKLKSPFLTVDAIIEVKGGIVLIERSNPPFGFALPGGFVDYGESLEDAVIREAKEETNLDIRDVRQFHTYSAPGNDPRFHTVSTVFISHAEGVPKAGDDAAEAHVVAAEKIEHLSFAFHHKKIIQDYLIFKAGGDPFKSV